MKEKITEIISQTLGVTKESINKEDRLVDLADDSIKLFGLLIAFEREFSMQIEYKDIAHIETVGDIFSYVGDL